MKNKIPYNINDRVSVKLTDFGRACLRENHRSLKAKLDRELPFCLKEPTEDSEGWSEWQMHNLMSEFGKYIRVGSPNIPFETNIEIIAYYNEQIKSTT